MKKRLDPYACPLFLWSSRLDGLENSLSGLLLFFLMNARKCAAPEPCLSAFLAGNARKCCLYVQKFLCIYNFSKKYLTSA